MIDVRVMRRTYFRIINTRVISAMHALSPQKTGGVESMDFASNRFRMIIKRPSKGIQERNRTDKIS